jgi:hypothetical protein
MSDFSIRKVKVLQGRAKAEAEKHPNGYKFPGKNKCKGCPHAQYKKEAKS